MPTRSLGTVKYGLWNRGRVSPLRPGRKASALLVVAVLLSLGFAGLAAAQDQPAAAAPRQIYLAPMEDTAKAAQCPTGVAPCWDINVVPVVPGEAVQFVIDLSHATQPHNFILKDATGNVLGQAADPKGSLGGVY